MDLTLNVWRQAGPGEPGRMVEYRVQGVDEHFSHVAVWEWAGADQTPLRREEPLVFENVHLATRSYT